MRNTKFAVHANSAKATAIPHDVDAVRLNVYSESFRFATAEQKDANNCQSEAEYHDAFMSMVSLGNSSEESQQNMTNGNNDAGNTCHYSNDSSGAHDHLLLDSVA